MTPPASRLLDALERAERRAANTAGLVDEFVKRGKADAALLGSLRDALADMQWEVPSPHMGDPEMTCPHCRLARLLADGAAPEEKP